MFKGGKTIYHIDRVIRETGEVQDNGLQEIYVNTKIDDGSDVAELMRIFKNLNAYDFKKFPKVSGRKRQFKESDEGDERMCELVENYAKKVAEKVAAQAAADAIAKEKENALRLFQNGVSYEVVRASILSISDEDLQQIYDEAISR